jgi:DNA-binding winged helix-turn-helix (wHTH) protein/Tol biopolymer transport system component
VKTGFLCAKIARNYVKLQCRRWRCREEVRTMTAPTITDSGMNGRPAGDLPSYRFADLTLDVGQRRVWRGEQRVGMSNLSFELLRVLVEAAPNVVPHDELATKAWGPRRVVTPENVAKRVMLLRQSLGDQAAESRYIEGVRGRGYRLLPEAQRSAALAPARDGGEPGVDRGARRRAPSWTYAAAAIATLAALLLVIDDLRLRSAGDAGSAGVEAPFSFVVAAPQGTRFDMAPASPTPALAPDGRSLAFIAPVGSQQMLFIQTLGELAARALPGTEGAGRPFWSPDGRFVAFVTDTQLRRIATTGAGAPQDVIALSRSDFQGGAWAPDGTIMFGATNGLYRVGADGNAVAWTTLDTSRGEYSHRTPAFLPGSERFVYLVLSTELEHQGIFLGSLADRSLKIRLAAGAANAAAGIDEHGRTNLLFLNDDNALVAQPFDASLERLTGEPVIVASRPVETGPSVRAAAFTASGRVLAYRPLFAPASHLGWIDRHGVRSDVVMPAGQSYRFPALSDDGTRLVAMRADEPGAAGLWWLELEHGANPERLTRGAELMSAWAPDGRYVVYSSPQPQGWSLLRQPLSGRDDVQSLLAGPEPVVKRIRDVTDNYLVFQGSDGDFWLQPLAGEEAAHAFMRTPGLENHARVSPNGRFIAFSATDANETRVYVTTFPQATDVWTVAAGSDPQWRNDGRELYYIGPGELLMAVEVETDGRFATGKTTALFDARFDPQSRQYGSAYAAAPDGERFLVAELAADSEVELIVTRNWARERAPPR